MVIHSDQWHFRLYLWSRRVVLHFRNRDRHFDEWREKRGVNLCPYMRTILLWMPSVVVLNLAVVGWVLYVYLVLPFRLFGAMAVGLAATKVLGGLLAAAIFIGIIVGLAKLGILYWDWRAKSPVLEEEPQRPGFFKLLGVYIRAMHEKVCPHIEVREV